MTQELKEVVTTPHIQTIFEMLTANFEINYIKFTPREDLGKCFYEVEAVIILRNKEDEELFKAWIAESQFYFSFDCFLQANTYEDADELTAADLHDYMCL